MLLLIPPAIGPITTSADIRIARAYPNNLLENSLPNIIIEPFTISCANSPIPSPTNRTTGRHISCRNLTPTNRSGSVTTNHIIANPMLQPRNLTDSFLPLRIIKITLSRATIRIITPPRLLIIPEPDVIRAPSSPFSRTGISESSTMYFVGSG